MKEKKIEEFNVYATNFYSEESERKTRYNLKNKKFCICSDKLENIAEEIINACKPKKEDYKKDFEIISKPFLKSGLLPNSKYFIDRHLSVYEMELLIKKINEKRKEIEPLEERIFYQPTPNTKY